MTNFQKVSDAANAIAKFVRDERRVPVRVFSYQNMVQLTIPQVMEINLLTFQDGSVSASVHMAPVLDSTPRNSHIYPLIIRDTSFDTFKGVVPFLEVWALSGSNLFFAE